MKRIRTRGKIIHTDNVISGLVCTYESFVMAMTLPEALAELLTVLHSFFWLRECHAQCGTVMR